MALTDLAPEVPARYSLPLNLSSVERLLSAYARILSQLKEREDAASNHSAGDASAIAHQSDAEPDTACA
ncbi:MAG: hypothetical protein M3R15_07340, partial [Acidobacteriota bacterium]|nr:hypothetical protein [Acidobacteriota bacterium]